MIKKLLVVAILVLTVYSVYLVIVPYYHYQAFSSDLREILHVSVIDTEGQVREKIMELVATYEIPVTEEDIELWRDKRYEVRVSWQETVDFFTLYQKTFDFDIDTTQ